MAKGKIKRVVDEKGFGFIAPDDGSQDVFFHKSALVGVRLERLEEGDPVQYESEKGPKGLRATHVERAA